MIGVLLKEVATLRVLGVKITLAFSFLDEAVIIGFLGRRL